jgi:hypothetical protein
MPWLVMRHGQEMNIGEAVWVWVSGKKAGIYATAEIVSLAEKLEDIPDRNYGINKSRLGRKPQAIIRFTAKFIEQPLLREQLKLDPVWEDLLIIRAPNSTNFKVTPQQWQRVD